jgi:NRAMP (natural resistance-associated macrophage protein)-like metal ion transporter
VEHERDSARSKSNDKSPLSSIRSYLNVFGPGVVTGAADDDPSGIATYSQAGAQFGFGMLWMMIFLYPLMTVIQEMCARVGLVTGNGLGYAISKKYSKKVLFPLAGLLLVANTINIGADIGAMSASARLIVPQLPGFVLNLVFAGFILTSMILIPYKSYVKVLKYLAMALFAYVISAVIVGGNLSDMLLSSVIPQFQFNSQYALMFVAMLGTTISPYLFFWQASEEAEEEVAKGKVTDINSPESPQISKKEVKNMRADVAIGMAFSQVIGWFIIVTAAGALHAHGVTNVSSAEQAASALEPLVKTFPHSGEIAKTIFAVGIIGTGLLAIPVLAGSSAYALSDGFGWKQGLHKKFKQAKAFYAVIAASTLIGLWINFSNIDPIQALIYTAVINGLTAVPILIAVIKIANDKKMLGSKTNSKLVNCIAWSTAILMGISDIVLLLMWNQT